MLIMKYCIDFKMLLLTINQVLHISLKYLVCKHKLSLLHQPQKLNTFRSIHSASFWVKLWISGNGFSLMKPWTPELFLGAYIRMSEVWNSSKTQPWYFSSSLFESSSFNEPFWLTPPPLLSPAHSHPPCWTDEASFCCQLHWGAWIFHPAAASEDIRAQWINYIWG